MSQTSVLLAGATGFVGNQLVQLLIENKEFTDQSISIISRRELSLQSPKLKTYLTPFDRLAELQLEAQPSVAFCSLGTTMKNAGSKEAFYKVDFTYVKNFAELAYQNEAKTFVLVTAMGADKTSLFYYNRIKGEIEEAIQKIGFDRLHILRPSLLMGERQESRLGEKLGQLTASAFSFLIPDKYKGIEGKTLAKAMWKLAAASYDSGVYIHESDELQKLGA